jgi:hypothetical protein
MSKFNSLPTRSFPRLLLYLEPDAYAEGPGVKYTSYVKTADDSVVETKDIRAQRNTPIVDIWGNPSEVIFGMGNCHISTMSPETVRYFGDVAPWPNPIDPTRLPQIPKCVWIPNLGDLVTTFAPHQFFGTVVVSIRSENLHWNTEVNLDLPERVESLIIRFTGEHWKTHGCGQHTFIGNLFRNLLHNLDRKMQDITAWPSIYIVVDHDADSKLHNLIDTLWDEESEACAKYRFEARKTNNWEKDVQDIAGNISFYSSYIFAKKTERFMDDLEMEQGEDFAFGLVGADGQPAAQTSPLPGLTPCTPWSATWTPPPRKLQDEYAKDRYNW